MFKLLLNSIDYAKLIKLQSRQGGSKILRQESKNLQVCVKPKKVKSKIYNVYNGVTRHH